MVVVLPIVLDTLEVLPWVDAADVIAAELLEVLLDATIVTVMEGVLSLVLEIIDDAGAVVEAVAVVVVVEAEMFCNSSSVNRHSDQEQQAHSPDHRLRRCCCPTERSKPL